MPYCRNCGTQMRNEDRFCMSCGAPVQIIQPAPVIIQQIIQEKPKVPGRGLGICSMVVSIVGLLYALVMFPTILNLLSSSNFLEVSGVSMLVMLPMIAAASIMSLPFSLTARKRGYITGVSAAGLIMGVIGTIIWATELGALIVGVFYYM